MTARLHVPLGPRCGNPTKDLAKNLKALLRGAMAKSAREAVLVLRYNTANAPPASDGANSKPGAVASGELWRGWAADPERNGQEYGVTVYNASPYAPFVEGGVKTSDPKLGRLAFQMLERWVMQRGIFLLSMNGQRVLTPAEAAYVIGRSINKRTGYWRFKPRKIMERSRLSVKRVFLRNVKEARERALAEAGRK